MTSARSLAHLAHFMLSTVNTPENASTMRHALPSTNSVVQYNPFFPPFFLPLSFSSTTFATRPSIRTSNIQYIMANLVPSAKPVNRWGPYELIAFNINVVSEEVETFFGNADLPQLTVSSVVLNNLEESTDPYSNLTWTSSHTWKMLWP